MHLKRSNMASEAKLKIAVLRLTNFVFLFYSVGGEERDREKNIRTFIKKYINIL